MGTPLKDTNFYLFATTLILTLINFLMYLTNRKTFNILYEKPKILNIEIQFDDNNPRTPTYINVDIINPSSFDNHIIKYSLKCVFSRTIVDEGQLNESFPSAIRKDLDFRIDRELSEKYRNKFVFLALTDIKGRKTWKKFRFKNSRISY